MKLTPVAEVGRSRTSSLTGLTAKQVEEAIGFPANVTKMDDPDKVAYSWGFTDGQRKAFVWSYYNSHRCKQWSADGCRSLLRKVFGEALTN
jgi:hypothetical protein